MAVNHKNGGETSDQRQQGLVDRMGEALGASPELSPLTK
jgi:hypothetical protein